MYEHLLCFGLFSAWYFFKFKVTQKSAHTRTHTHTLAQSKCGLLLRSCPKCWNTKSCLVAAPCLPGGLFFSLLYFSSLYNSYARSYFKNPRSLQKNKSLWHSASLFLWNWVSYVSWSEKKVAAYLIFFFVHKSPRIWVNGLLWKRRQQQVEEALLNLFVYIMTPLSVATPRKVRIRLRLMECAVGNHKALHPTMSPWHGAKAFKVLPQTIRPRRAHQPGGLQPVNKTTRAEWGLSVILRQKTTRKTPTQLVNLWDQDLMRKPQNLILWCDSYD